MYLLVIIAFYRDQPNWEKSAEEKDSEVEKKMINFNVTDADRNEFGEKYLLQKVKSDIGIIHLPIIIGVYSAFCNFLAQSGLMSPLTDRTVSPTDSSVLSRKSSFRYGNLYNDLFQMVFKLGSNGKCNDLYSHWRHCFYQV